MKAPHRRTAFKGTGWIGPLIVGAIGLVVIACGIYSYAYRVENATEALTRKGYTAVKVGKWYPWCWTRTVGSHFSAIGPNGKPVQGTVCQSPFFSTIDVN